MTRLTVGIFTECLTVGPEDRRDILEGCKVRLGIITDLTMEKDCKLPDPLVGKVRTISHNWGAKRGQEK